MQQKAINDILDQLPDQVNSFENSQYPLPVKTTFLADKEINIPSLKKELFQKQNSDVKDILEPLLLAAELYEASCPDKEQYFLSDLKVQSYVFSGSKWKAGWTLVLGGDDQQELIDKLNDRDFMVFTDLPDIPDTIYIGNRPTSPIYFLQMMVRYGLIWGGIAPGDDHQMGHFLEKDMPGLIIIYKDLDPLKYHITLGLMKLGAPAVVPSTFPFPYGNCIKADTISDIIDKGLRFDNLRQRYYNDELITLPDYCNVAWAQEKFDSARNLAGQSDSFFALRPVNKVDEKLKIHGAPNDNLAILVEIQAQDFSPDIAKIVETAALKAINYLSGIRAYDKKGIFHLELAANTQLNEQHIADAIYWGIRLEYPRLDKICVTIIYDPDKLADESQKARQYKKQRQDFIENMTEENTDIFCACTECRPFSLVHTCIATPQRKPMCNSRSYAFLKTAASFGSSKTPWQRPTEKDVPLRYVFKKGKVIDPLRGEYEGSNEMYRQLTGGKLKRVFLHSLRDFPATSCGCFQTLAFWMEQVGGIGIMLRNSPATTPDGRTWEFLASQAGGKQTPGITGVSIAYIRSPEFLKGDGGFANVLWTDSALHKIISGIMKPTQKVATEKEVTTMEELKLYHNR